LIRSKKKYSLTVSSNTDGTRYVKSSVWGDFKFHDLRKTFGSILAQNGISTAVTQKLLEHSSPDLTNKVYTNVDPVLRHVVDQIPAGDWL